MVSVYDLALWCALSVSGQLAQTVKSRATLHFRSRNNELQGIRGLIKAVYSQDFVTSPISDKLIFKRNDSCWYVYDYQCIPQKLVYQGEPYLNTSKVIHARSDLGKWFKFQNVSKEFRAYVQGLPVIAKSTNTAPDPNKVYHTRRPVGKSNRAETPICDSILVTDGRYWYAPDKLGVRRKITHRSDRLWTVGYTYARTEDGQWLKLLKPPDEFRSYYCGLPRKGIYSLLNRLHYSYSTKTWLVQDDTNELMQITHRGRPNSLDPAIKHFCDVSGRWYTVRKPPLKFVFWILTLPLKLRKNDFHDNFQLVERDNGTLWQVKNYKGVPRKIKASGDNPWCRARDIYTVLCDDGKSYKFKAPPEKFKLYISTLPKMEIECLKKNMSRSIANKSHTYAHGHDRLVNENVH